MTKGKPATAAAAAAGAKGMLGKAVKAINPLELFREVTKAYGEYATIREQEQTKRDEIAARLQADLAEISAKRELLLKYLDAAFDERREVFRKMFLRLDTAIDGKKNEQVAQLLDGIVKLAESNPFPALRSIGSLRDALQENTLDVEL